VHTETLTPDPNLNLNPNLNPNSNPNPPPVFGHIHEGFGAYQDERGQHYLNASTSTIQYRPINPPVVLDVPLDRRLPIRWVRPSSRLPPRSFLSPPPWSSNASGASVLATLTCLAFLTSLILLPLSLSLQVSVPALEVTHLDLSDGPPRSHPVVGDAFPSSLPSLALFPRSRSCHTSGSESRGRECGRVEERIRTGAGRAGGKGGGEDGGEEGVSCGAVDFDVAARFMGVTVEEDTEGEGEEGVEEGGVDGGERAPRRATA